MKVPLITPFELSSEHGRSVYGSPVLVNCKTGEAYGPTDSVKFFDWPTMLAQLAVRRMALTRNLTIEELRFIDRFR